MAGVADLRQADLTFPISGRCRLRPQRTERKQFLPIDTSDTGGGAPNGWLVDVDNYDSAEHSFQVYVICMDADSTFRFLEFRGCHIPYHDFKDTMPLDPGVRRTLANELAREAGAAGKTRDARRYRLIEEAANERHLWNLAWASGGPYYEKHRPPLVRVQAALSWVGRKFNRLLWGYGSAA